MGKHDKTKNNKIIVLSILRMIFIITMIISIAYIIKWYVDNKQNKELQEKVSGAIENIEVLEIEESVEIKYKIDFEKLKEINSEVVGWIKVNNTQIEHAVVQTNNNNYYLKRNLEKQYNIAGWIFADYKNKLDGTDKNIIIYGHNMKDDSMFGTLKNILKEEWYNNEENYIVNFITEKEEQKYQVFSVYQIKSEDYYISTEFENNEFEEFINTLKNRSLKDFNINVLNEDKILTLSTCADDKNYRIVLHAKKIN